jgi:pyruvate dehydrogenase E1 component alpha subunit
VEHSSAEPELFKRGASYRIPGVRVDGDDVLAVRDAARTALDQARTLRQPVLLEVMCFRLRGHSVVDPARYRSAEDTTIAQEADPVPLFRATLIAAGVLDEAEADVIDTDAADRVTAAVDFADRSPDPSPDDLFAYVYATAVANAPSALPGDPVTEAL